MNFILTLIALSVSLFGAAKDGLSDRYKTVGWTWWHILGWLGRDVPVWSIIVILFLNGAWWHTVLIIISRLLHAPIYRWFRRNYHWFIGQADPPAWWLWLRKLWGQCQV